MSEHVTEAMLLAAYHATGCPVHEHGPGPLNREFFKQIYLAMRAASVDRSPEGEKPQALSAKHESAVAESQTPNNSRTTP